MKKKGSKVIGIITISRVPATPLTFKDVFAYPEYLLRGIESWRHVSLLGSKNIAALISSARSHEKSITNEIASLKQETELLRGKSGEDFKEMAKGFENPTLPEIGVPEDSWSKDLEPLDAASKVRKGDATTFNMCGWCKHAGGGTCRYGFHITTRCGLLGNSPETAFNTPCLLQAKTSDEIAVEVKRLENETENLLARREKVRQGISLLQSMKVGAQEKPYLMSLRPHDHFKVGDEVMVYVGQWGSEGKHRLTIDQSITNPHASVWVPAIVVFGYRHHDGCVSYQTLFPVHNNMSNFEGRGGGAGMSRPEVLLRSEFNYLQEAATKDTEFFFRWLDNVDTLKGLDRYTFRKDLTSGTVANPPADWQPPTDEIEVKSVKDAEGVLQMLNSSLFETEKSIRDWAAMQLRHVHPDKLQKADENVKSYAARQTRAVYAARDLLIARLRNRGK